MLAERVELHGVPGQLDGHERQGLRVDLLPRGGGQRGGEAWSPPVVAGHKLVTGRFAAWNAMRSPVDKSTTMKTLLPETSCPPHRSVSGRT